MNAHETYHIWVWPEFESLQELVLIDCSPNFAGPMLRKTLAKNNGQLRYLHVQSYEMIVSELLNAPDANVSGLKELHLKCPEDTTGRNQLFHAIERLAGQLTNLSLREGVDELVFETIVAYHASNLENLSCHVRFEAAVHSLAAFVNITHLNLEWSTFGSKLYRSTNDHELALLLNSCKKLKHLNVAHCLSRSLSKSAFTSLPINAPLTYLNISGYALMDDSVLVALEKYLSDTLEYLVIGSTEGFTQLNLVGFIGKMAAAKLKCLDLSGSKVVTNESDEFLMLVLVCLEPLRSAKPGKVMCLKCDDMPVVAVDWLKNDDDARLTKTVIYGVNGKKWSYSLMVKNLELVYKDKDYEAMSVYNRDVESEEYDSEEYDSDNENENEMN
jgi:hypothetical protein